MNEEKKAFNLKDLLIYFILIPFLRPNGYNTYFPLYKQFFTVWLYLAIMIIFMYSARMFFGNKIKYKSCIVFMIIYYLVMILTTFVNLFGFGNGLQKMFAAPALFLACFFFLKRDIRQFVNCVANLFVINMTLNITIFSSALNRKYFNPPVNHLMFLGHIQMGAQMGIVGIFVAYILYRLIPNMKAKSIFLVMLCFANMVYATTDASIISIIVFGICLLIAFLTKKSKLYKIDARIIFAAFIVLDLMFLVIFLPKYHWVISFRNFSLNSRGVIWRLMMDVIKESPICGYGVQGKTIITPWAVGLEGLNYAHNESLQVMLDGGIILAFCYVSMFISFIKNINFINDYKLIVVAKSCLIVFLILMIFESTSNYYYWCIFLSMLSFLPETEELICQRRRI